MLDTILFWTGCLFLWITGIVVGAVFVNTILSEEVGDEASDVVTGVWVLFYFGMTLVALSTVL